MIEKKGTCPYGQVYVCPACGKPSGNSYIEQLQNAMFAARKDAMIETAKRCVELANDCAAGYEVVEAIEREFKL